MKIITNPFYARRMLFFLFLAATLIAQSQENLSYERLESTILNRLVGTWQVEGKQSYEAWSLSGDSVYHALAYSVVDGEVVPDETIRIIREAGEIYYEARVNGQNDDKPVRFRLSRLDSCTVAFTNERHDFPKSIVYEFNGHDRIKATVSDGSGEGGKSFTINFERMTKTKKVTGIGGIFFKSEDPEKMKEWYYTHLGLAPNEYGSVFEFRHSDEPGQKGYLLWSPFNAATKYFQPSAKEFMINYRVENLEALVEELKQNGVTILDTIEQYEYGKFIHILDPENNKIELWEPVDSVFTGAYEGKTTK